MRTYVKKLSVLSSFFVCTFGAVLSGCAMQIFDIGGGDMENDIVHVERQLFFFGGEEQVVDAREICGRSSYIDYVVFARSPKDFLLSSSMSPVMNDDVPADRLGVMATSGNFGFARSVSIYCSR